ncbi:MAG: SDR family oxidoreductase [Bacteroidota bacterium]|nr:SDR family oxidoreductase [Bacteroidota bacterium]
MKDKVIIITGASSGIGKALATECYKRGAKVVLAARNEEKLNELKKQLADQSSEKKVGVNNSSRILVITSDVSNESDCINLIEQTVKYFGTIDILINNAGISMRALFEELELNVIRRLMDVNFWGTVYCTKYALPYILQKRGSIVGISSIAGYRGLPGRTGYSASKFAMQGFLEVLRTENLKKGLHVLTACPGFTASNIRNTALTKDGSEQSESPRDEDKMMSAQDVAIHVADAIEKRKRTIVLTAQGKLTVLLNKLFPAMMDKIVYNHMAKEPNSPFK